MNYETLQRVVNDQQLVIDTQNDIINKSRFLFEDLKKQNLIQKDMIDILKILLKKIDHKPLLKIGPIFIGWKK